MINSLLDTDLYKLTMMQAVLHHFPGAEVEYRFCCRTDGVDLRPVAARVRSELAALCRLRFTEEELTYLAGLRYIKPDFVDFLRLFRLQHRFVEVSDAGDELQIVIRGPWLHTILFEVPLLAIVNETHFSQLYPHADLEQGRVRLDAKIALVRDHPQVQDFHFADFGTRRRFSGDWHRYVVETLQQALGGHFVGTSNLLFAMRTGLVPIGTMAHEFLQACQVLGPRLADSQRFAFSTWVQEYQGDLGIALSDVVGVDAFLRDFDIYFCKLFEGARQDSGDPIAWVEKLLAHYQRNRIDPRTKHLVFSDGLDIPRAGRRLTASTNRVEIQAKQGSRQ